MGEGSTRMAARTVSGLAVLLGLLLPLAAPALVSGMALPSSREAEARAAGEPTDGATEPAAAEHGERMGPYAQPRWTLEGRRFPTTEVYVVPRNNVQLERSTEVRAALQNPPALQTRSGYLVEAGLGHRLQLGIGLERDPEELQQPAAEPAREDLRLRYALADWNRLWGNPTLHLRWALDPEKPLAGELALLLGGDLAPRLHWGANLGVVRGLEGEAPWHQYELSAALSWTLPRGGLSLGAEVKGTAAAGPLPSDAAVPAYALLVGPSLQWRPTSLLYLDLALLCGAGQTRGESGTADGPVLSPLTQPMLVTGWDF